MKTTYIMHNGELVRAVRVSRPSVAPYIITDTMAPLLHPATGQMFDSKAAFRDATRAAGYEEVGNETAALLAMARPVEPEGVAEDVARAYEMVEQGYRPEPLDVAEPGTRIL